MTRPAAPAAPLVGAHMSIAGGLHHAILAAARHRCGVVQIFSKSSNQWRERRLTDEDIGLWREALARHPMIPVVHGSYLINLATPDRVLLRRSREAFLEEVRRCDLLGIEFLVFHPGAHMGAGEKEGLGRIVESLNWVHERTEGSRTSLLIETTAGQGSCLGHRLEHIATILEGCRRRERLGVCVDTCHLLAAGYDFRTPEGYAEVFGELDRRIGIERIRLFHANDSKKDVGCRVDRHEHIGKGYVGSAAFALLMGDPRFEKVPKLIETPKVGEMDRRNLARLRRLARERRPGRPNRTSPPRGLPGRI